MSVPATLPEKPLSILHVMRAPVGGLFRHVLDLSREQSRRGHAVGIVADSTSADTLTMKRLADISPSLRLGLSLIPMRRQPGVGDAAAARSIMKIAHALDLDVMHGHGAKGGAYARLAKAWLAARGERVRVFYTPHGGSLHFKPGTAAGSLFTVLERAMGRVTDGLIFESQFALKAYERLAGAGGPPRRVIPNGLRPEDFAVRAPDAAAADFLFIGELRTLKGVDVLLEALAQIAARRPVRAVIVGAGRDAETFKAQAQALELGDHASFLGAMPAHEAFALGRCLVVPSRAESFPYVVLEAGAAGLPLIATDVGGIPEIVAGTQTALIAPGSADALAEVMDRVLDDPDGAYARAVELREAVQAKFTVAAMTDGVVAFYRSVIAR
ncbi:MAG: glycosyltransferase family 4 protein [Hyphomicrobium sp.]|uniref:glycosyltransferase family 4 protein n=1 Tax=Hyphomicrobium sp. TaxID=82 RepID=UPI003D0B88C8